MATYILHWEGCCDPARNTEVIAVPEGKVVCMTRAPQVHDTEIQATNCTQHIVCEMAAGGEGNSAQISVQDNDVLCFTSRTNDDANSVIIDVTNPR